MSRKTTSKKKKKKVFNSYEDFKKKCLTNPTFFSENILASPGLTWYQEQAFKEIIKNSKVAISSCHGLGKTYLLAEVVLTLLYMLGPKCTIITTAPTWNQVEGLLWAEIGQKFKRAKYNLGGRLLTTQIKIAEKWTAIGLSPKVSKTSDSATFQGFHNEQVVIVFDEATGIDPQHFIAAESMLTSQNVKWICIGNPTDPNVPFAKLFKDADWKKIKWSCFHSPNLAANKITNIEQLRREAKRLRGLTEASKLKRLDSYNVVNPELVTLKWVVGRLLKWGEDSPLFKGRVLGVFPDVSEDTLVSVNVVERLMSGDYGNAKLDNVMTTGVDVARYGRDASIIFSMVGNKQHGPKKRYTKRNTVFLAGKIKQHVDENRNYKHKIGIDVGGIGAGVYDMCVEDPKYKHVEWVEINFGGKALDEERYVNCTTEMHCKAADDLRSEDGIILLPDDDLTNEICSRKYKFDKDGRYWLESKDDFRKRLGYSPDTGDGFVICNYLRGDMHPKVGTFTSDLGDMKGTLTGVTTGGGELW